MRHDHFFASAALLDEAENVAQEERAKRASAATERIKLAKEKKASSSMDESEPDETPKTKGPGVNPKPDLLLEEIRRLHAWP
jgi:hypothetical protein